MNPDLLRIQEAVFVTGLILSSGGWRTWVLAALLIVTVVSRIVLGRRP